MKQITLTASDLMSCAHDDGYALRIVFATESEIPEFIATKYMGSDTDHLDVVEEFRIHTDENGNEIDNGKLNPVADYGEFFTESFLDDFRKLAERDPTDEDWELFDSEIRSWVRHYADAESKQEQEKKNE